MGLVVIQITKRENIEEYYQNFNYPPCTNTFLRVELFRFNALRVIFTIPALQNVENETISRYDLYDRARNPHEGRAETVSYVENSHFENVAGGVYGCCCC